MVALWFSRISYKCKTVNLLYDSDGRRMMQDNGQRPVAICHLNDLGDLKILHPKSLKIFGYTYTCI